MIDFDDKDGPKMSRQETLARRIGRALDEMDARNAEHCPDGEILAAFAESGLSQADAEKWESHFATCSRCRKILHVLAVSADTPLAEKEVAHLGELVAGTRTPSHEIASEKAEGRARSVIPMLRRNWVAPAIGIAAVLLVWIAMRPPWRATERRAPENLVAQAQKEQTPAAAAAVEDRLQQKDTRAQDQKTEPAPAPEQPLAKSLAPNSAAPPARIAESLDTGSARDALKGGGGANSVPEKKEAGGASNSNALDQASPAAPPPAPAKPSQAGAPAQAFQASQARTASNMATRGGVQAQLGSDKVPAVPSRERQAVTAQGGAVAASGNSTLPQDPSAQMSGAAPAQALAAARAAQAGPAFLKAPGSSVVWRAGRGGSIERSSDNGMTWVSQVSPSQQDWLAGAAFSDKVCWLAGSKGAIARTVDGGRWELISPPAQAAAPGGGQPDWTVITALDALNATVTAADGRKFNTPDGGLTWQPE